MSKKYYAIAMLIFLVLSVFMNRDSLTTGGYHTYIDRSANVDLTSFREDFFSLYKGGANSDFDNAKRIVLHWIFFFTDEEVFDRIRFAALTFLSMGVSFHIFLRLIENEKYRIAELEKHAIAFVGAFFYMVNSISVEHFIALYPKVSYVLLPVAFYCIYMSFKSRKNTYPILFGAISFFLIMLVIHNALYLTIMAACVAMVFFLSGSAKLSDIISKAIISIVVFAALSLFIIFPLAYTILNINTPHPGYTNSVDYVQTIATNTKMLNIMLIDYNLHFWTLWGRYEYPFGNAYYPIMAIIIAIVIAIGLFYRNALAVVAGLNFAVFSFLTNGINSPAGELYQWVIFNFEFGWLIRSSAKFSIILPLFFSILLVHFLLRIASRKKLFCAAIIVILLNQGVFSWPVWTGDMAGQVVKQPAHKELIGSIKMLKQDATEMGKIAWYGDFPGSSPREKITPKSLAIKYLLDNPNPQQSIYQMAKSLELKYLIIDKYPRSPWYNLGYTKRVLPYIEGNLDQIHIYEGYRFKLFQINDDVERLYIPKAVFLLYSGYDGIHAISSLVDVERDIAFVMGDDEEDYGGSLDDYVDVVVLDSKYNPFPEMDKNNIILMDGQSDKGTDWKKSTANSDAWQGTWLKELEEIGLSSDQQDYGHGLIFTSSPDSEYHSTFRINESDDYSIFLRVFKSPEGGALKIKVNGENEVILDTLSDIIGFEWIKIYDGPLDVGENTLGIKNHKGFNAVNIGYYTQKGSMESYLDDKGIVYIYEAENEFESRDTWLKSDSSFSNGMVLAMSNSSDIWGTLHVYNERVYYFMYKGTDVLITIDGKNVTDSGMFLETGNHSIDVQPVSDNSTLDYLILYDKQAMNIMNALKDNTLKDKGIVDYQRTGKTSYVAQAKINEPSLLVFTANYNKGFVAHLDETHIQPIKIFSVVNAFPINKAGNVELEVEYGPQKWFDIGLVLSIFSAILMAAYLVNRWKQ